MTEINYQELAARLGQPLTEKHLAGATGVRADNWPCGCLRIVRMRTDEMDVQFYSCAAHEVEFRGKIIW